MADLQAADAGVNFLRHDLYVTKLFSLSISELVHGLQTDVEANPGVVDGEDVNSLALVGQLPA